MTKAEEVLQGLLGAGTMLAQSLPFLTDHSQLRVKAITARKASNGSIVMEGDWPELVELHQQFLDTRWDDVVQVDGTRIIFRFANALATYEAVGLNPWNDNIVARRLDRS